jgi:NAD(P) transhydrogenase subunit beta
MNMWVVTAEAVVVALLFGGIAQFRTPRGAWRGNLMSAAAFALAVVVVLAVNGSEHVVLTVLAVAVGAAAGYAVALRVSMLQIPAMVAFQHGCGGIAAFLVSFVELVRTAESTNVLLQRSSGLLGLVIGAATASGSVIAAAKLAAIVAGTPVVLRAHSALVGATAALSAVLIVVAATPSGVSTTVVLASVLLVLALLLGVLIALRIGGADMPVLVSFLNASAGLAAAFAGVALSNRLLVVCGATVAASGSILTMVMCRAMNRSLLRIFTGISVKPTGLSRPTSTPVQADSTTDPDDEVQTATEPMSPVDQAVADLAVAGRVVIVPGYGMALAQAQFVTVELSQVLAARGVEVSFAVHPVAGRMPGHMNVLLAEADASYDQLVEMDEINPVFPVTDVVVVIGACDVVNPAAQEVADTPIAGMPILNVQEARRVVVCNLDEKPGYSGVPNSLYERPGTLLLLGDARATIEAVVAALRAHS